TELELPTVVVVKFKLPGSRVIAGRGDAPVPLSRIDCGLPGALSVMVKLACRAPAAVGENTTLMVQVALGASTVGAEQLGERRKSAGSAPIRLMEVTLSA